MRKSFRKISGSGNGFWDLFTSVTGGLSHDSVSDSGFNGGSPLPGVYGELIQGEDGSVSLHHFDDPVYPDQQPGRGGSNSNGGDATTITIPGVGEFVIPGDTGVPESVHFDNPDNVDNSQQHDSGYIDGNGNIVDTPGGSAASNGQEQDPFLGFLQGLFGSGGAFGGLGGLIDSLVARLTGAHLTGAEREANEFSAQQAELDRSFQSTQADIARDWQEEMFNKYQSPAALMSQYRDAGINPMLVAGGHMPQISTNPATPSGAQAASVSPSQPLDLISSIIGIIKAKSEIDLTKSQADKNRADAAKTEKDTSWIDRLNNLTLDKGTAEVGNLNAKTDEARANISLINEEVNRVLSETNLNNNERKMALAAQSALAFAQKTLAEEQTSSVKVERLEKAWRSQFISEHGLSPELAGQLASALGSAVVGVTAPLLRLFPRFGR